MIWACVVQERVRWVARRQRRAPTSTCRMPRAVRTRAGASASTATRCASKQPTALLPKPAPAPRALVKLGARERHNGGARLSVLARRGAQHGAVEAQHAGRHAAAHDPGPWPSIPDPGRGAWPPGGAGGRPRSLKRGVQPQRGTGGGWHDLGAFSQWLPSFYASGTEGKPPDRCTSDPELLNPGLPPPAAHCRLFTPAHIHHSESHHDPTSSDHAGATVLSASQGRGGRPRHRPGAPMAA